MSISFWLEQRSKEGYLLSALRKSIPNIIPKIWIG